jgi:hypothetical protein
LMVVHIERMRRMAMIENIMSWRREIDIGG